jgi:PAS domain S-box-containing protein
MLADDGLNAPERGSAQMMLDRLLEERDQLFQLHEALAEVERARSLEHRLRIFVDAIHRIGFERVAIVLRDTTSGATQMATAGFSIEEDHGLRRAAAAGDGWRQRLDDLADRHVSHSYLLESGELVVPLRGASGAIVGTLSVDQSVSGRPSLARVRTVELFAQQVASIIENARLYDESERERGRGEALAEIARAVNSSLRLDDVMQLSLRHASALLRTSGATLGLLYDEKIMLVAGIGDADCLVGAPLPLHASVAGKAILERRSVIVNDSSSEPQAYAPTRIAANVENTLITPLFSGEGAVGVLSVINRAGNFTEEDAVVLQRLADQVAVAVDNAQLFENAEAVAERYRRVLETSNDGIVITDRNRRIAFTNRAADVLFGVDGAAIGRPLSKFIAPELHDRVAELDARVLEGEAQRYEAIFVRLSGERRSVAASTAPLREGGQITGIVASLRDVTDERRARDAVAESEARYTRLVESATDAIFTVAPDGRLTAVNRSLERSIGRDRRELLGVPLAGLVDARDQATLTQALAECFEGRRRRIELRYRSARADVRHCSLILTPLHEGEKLTGALGIVRDVTDERRLTEQLVQQEKLAAVGQLVSGVAHELNNPLAGVIAFSQILARMVNDDPEQRRAIEAIDQEARRAAKIVSNLLTFARQHQPERTFTDLNRVVEDTIELRRYALRVAQIDVQTVLDPELPMTWADPFQLQQVVLNLLTNAEHALTGWDAEPECERRIVIKTECLGDQLVIRISDTGPGIATENLSRVFNPFFTTKAVGEGTGLGLSISDGIVREHDGRIRAESRPGRGATFIIELPHVEPPLVEPVGPLLDTCDTSSTCARKRILVVDDEAAIRSALRIYFESLGHDVDAAATGREALAAAAAAAYDVVLLDLRLPDATGDQLLVQLEAILGRATRIIFVTGDTHSVSARGHLEATGRPTVSKPFALDELAALALAPAER